MATAAYLKNRSTTSALNEDTTLYEQWYGRKPDLSHLRVFGCVAYADSDKKAEKLRFVGYCKNSKGYRLFDETTQTIKKRRDVMFNESTFNLDKAETKQLVVSVNPEMEEQSPVDEPLNDEPQPQQPCRSGRERSQPVRYGFNEYADTAKVDHVAYSVCKCEHCASMPASKGLEVLETSSESEEDRLGGEWETVEKASHKAGGAKQAQRKLGDGLEGESKPLSKNAKKRVRKKR